MPKLTEERRKQIQERTERERIFWEKIEQKYHPKSKNHAQCRLCGNYVTAIEPKDVFDTLKKHEQSHPEYKEWDSLSDKFDFSDLRGMLHDHDCVFAKCACMCGCQSSICVAEILPEKRNKPMLCGICELYQGRGHIEHRLPEEVKECTNTRLIYDWQ